MNVSRAHQVRLTEPNVVAIQQRGVAIMAMNPVQFQSGLSMTEFLKHYGTEAQCEQALESVRWPTGSRCPRCDGAAHYVRRKIFQCQACRHQASLIAGTVFQGSKLPLTILFLAIYLISQAKTGLSALTLKCQLGVGYPIAWPMHHTLMQKIPTREDRYVLEGNIQIDDAYLGDECTGGKTGRGSENKAPCIAAVSLTDNDRPSRVRLTPVLNFTLKAISVWASNHLELGGAVFSEGLSCFGAVTDAGCSHPPTVMAARKPKYIPEFRWINTVSGNLKTSFSGYFHTFDFRKYAAGYLAAFYYRFNQQFDLRTPHQRLLIAAATTTPQPLRGLRGAVADVHC